jgi:hypothetical protein
MLDKAKIVKIQADLKIALESVAAKHGLKLAKNYISYSAESFKLTAEFGDTSVLGDLNPAYVKDLKKFGWQYGLTEDHLNKTITSSKGQETIQGMKGQYVITKSADGKLWKKDATIVATLLGVVNAPPKFNLTQVAAPKV